LSELISWMKEPFAKMQAEWLIFLCIS